MVTALPQSVAAEILHHYADVLRRGSLRVNGVLVSWDASLQRLPEERLDGFSSALSKAMRAVPEVGQLADESFCGGAAYWICKALSINYAMSEVLHMVKRKVGRACSIESWSGQGAQNKAEYSIEIRSGPSLLVGISWCCSGNLVACDPLTAEKEVKGTISRIETEFSLPPPCGFTPAYHVEMEVCKKPTASSFPSFGCGALLMEHGDMFFERIILANPLRRNLPRDDRQPSVSMNHAEVEALIDAGDDPFCEDLRGSPRDRQRCLDEDIRMLAEWMQACLDIDELGCSPSGSRSPVPEAEACITAIDVAPEFKN